MITEENFDEIDERIYVPQNNDDEPLNQFQENEENQSQNNPEEEEEEKEKDYHPILTKPGYHTQPKMSELAKYSFETLMEIDNFCVFNEDGMVEFEGLTDLTYVNLDEILDISHVIELYPDERRKPREGEKLNKPAVLTFNKCGLLGKHKIKDLNSKKIKAKLTQLADKQVSLLILIVFISFIVFKIIN